jgi:hypothetical protein
LKYGVLEGPEHGVYFRGKTTNKVIDLPYYWKDLVDMSSITVQLTPIGKPTTHFFVEVVDSKIIIESETGVIDTFFFIQAERKDVEKIIIEYRSE